MHRFRIAQRVSDHAPTIEVCSLCLALAGSWVGELEWLAKGLAILVAGLALVVFASTRRRSRWVAADEEEGWLAQELAGRGTPAGNYVLIFFAVVTIVLVGVDTAYALLAWAALALGIAWGVAHAQYLNEDSSGG